jgi:hypothetical protein
MMYSIKTIIFLKMKKQLLLTFLFGWFTAAVYGYPMIGGIQTDQLLKASVIVIGQIDGMTNVGNSVIKDTIRRHGDIPANVLEIDVNLGQAIKGTLQTKIKVGGLLMPVDIDSFGYVCDNQIPNPSPEKRYVFFLSQGKNDSEYVPVSPKEFAVEIEHGSSEKATSPLEALRAIAKANVDGSNYVLAVRWAEFLSGLHDDFSYWTNKTHDPQILIRSTAYATLVQDFPQTPGLRSDLVKCLSDPVIPNDDSDVWMADYSFISSLSKLSAHDPLTGEEIRSLLGSGNRNVTEMALTLIRRKKDVSMAADVVHLMTTSKNRDVQYFCIQTLYRLADNPFCIMQQTFLEHPDDYIKEWKKIGENLGK